VRWAGTTGRIRMEIGYTEEHQALRNRLREYYANLLTPEVEAQLADSHGIGPHMRRVVKQMAADGWLGIGWPKEYGGQGLGPIEQYIFFDESMRAGAPVPMLTINTVGPTIMDFGTQEQKDFFLPKILAGDIHFCIGYTEPESGTDLASLQTRAVRDGDEYVINGQKIYTSLAGGADYIWLATRTDPDAPKHKGISMFIVPMDTPGIKVVPMHLLGDHNINYTFYEDVRVPAANLVGGENQGWSLITNQLNHERVTLCSSGIIERALDDVRAWAQDTKLADGRRVIDQEWVQVHLARVYARLEFLKLINWKVAWTATQGHLDVADASTIKVFGTEFYMEAFKLLMEVVGQAGYLTRDTPDAVLAGRLEMYARSMVILTFGGGTNEIQRDLIAIFGLGLPRSLR
jgi:alkylation response protein AidB-like acyl-CoA dehydrogenase